MAIKNSSLGQFAFCAVIEKDFQGSKIFWRVIMKE
jgi:hypothetical protein